MVCYIISIGDYFVLFLLIQTSVLFLFSARGGDLFARIDGDSLPEFEAVKILKQVLDALKFMHDREYMHLDLKVSFCSRLKRLVR